MADFFGFDLVVEVAFDDVPLEPAPAWTDITTFVRDIPNITRGSQDEFTPPSPGTASFVLDNRTRVFDPSHTGGTYHGKLTPNRRIRATIDGAALFDGFVTGWPMGFRGGGSDSLVTVTAIDMTRRLSNAKLQRSAYEAAVVTDSPICYWPFQEQNTTASAQYVDIVAGLLMYQSTVATSMSPVPTNPMWVELAAPIAAPIASSPGTSNYAIQITQLRELAGGGFTSIPPLPVDPCGLDFWCHFPDGAHLIQVTVSSPMVGGNESAMYIAGRAPAVDAPVPGIYVQYSNTTNGLSLVANTTVPMPLGLHHYALWFDGANVNLYIDGSLVYTAATSAALVAGGGRPGAAVTAIAENFHNIQLPAVSHIAAYPAGAEPDWAAHHLAGVAAFGHPFGECGGARIGRVLDEVGVPAAFRDLDTGDTVHGPYIPARQSALQYLRDVETAEDGMVFVSADGKVTFRGRQWQWVGSVVAALSFADDGSGLTFADITVDAASINTLRNTVSATYRNGDGYLAVSDQASIDAYEEVSEALSIPTVDRPSTARGLAGYRLAAWKDPTSRVTQLVVHSRAVPEVWGVELADRVVVKLTPVGVGSPLELEFLVRGVTHGLSPSGAASSTLYLAPAPVTAVDAPYLVVGDPVLGVTGAAAGNKIPF